MHLSQRIGWVAVLGVLFVVAVASDDSDSATTANAVTGQIGVPSTVGPLQITVEDISFRSSVGNSAWGERASEGAVYVCLRYAYKNVSNKPVPSMSFIGPSTPGNPELLDPNKVTYDLDLGATASYATELDLDSKFLSDLNPGITVRDADIFEVSRDLIRNPGWFIVITSEPPLMVPVPVLTGP